MRRVLENSAGLRPRDKGPSVRREGDVEGRSGLKTDGGGEGGGVSAIGGRDECRGRCRAPDPARVLSNERVEPSFALLLENQVECVENGVLKWLVSAEYKEK